MLGTVDKDVEDEDFRGLFKFDQSKSGMQPENQVKTSVFNEEGEGTSDDDEDFLAKAI